MDVGTGVTKTNDRQTIWGSLLSHAGAWSGAGIAFGLVVLPITVYLTDEVLWKLDRRWVIGTISLAGFSLATLGMTVFLSLRDLIDKVNTLVVRDLVPKVVSVKHAGEKTLFIVESTPLLAHEFMVTIYNVETSGFEQIVGVGLVVNVQANGFGKCQGSCRLKRHAA